MPSPANRQRATDRRPVNAWHCPDGIWPDRAPHARTWRPCAAAAGARAGFTYYDLMIVLAILAIMVTGTSMFWRAKMPQHRVDDAAVRIEAHLRASRLHAVSTGRRVVVALDSVTRRILTSVDTNGNGSIDAAERGVLRISAAPRLTVSANAAAGEFRPNGAFESPGGYWRIAIAHTGARDMYVYVLGSGHVQSSERALE